MAKNDATVLAFEKKLVPSDGFMYGTTWEQRREKNKSQPLALIEKSVRGTISNRLKKTITDDPLKMNAEVEKANLQMVDSCALGEEQDTLKLSFTLKVLGNIDKPSASNGKEFNKTYPLAAQDYITRTGFADLAKRYAINIANARYLWRNRVGAEKIEVVVSVDNQTFTFDAKQFALSHFDHSHADLDNLASKIAGALSGSIPYLMLTVDAYALVGKAQEVYPSEELVMDKGSGKKSKILYHVNKTAAMHSQKIGNALRSIDTWYPDFDNAEIGIGPIAIEPYGSVTNLGMAFRSGKANFYNLFDKFAMGEKLDCIEDEHYVMAILVRGGVFGQSGKEE